MSKFYICKICGNLVEKIEDSGIAPFCCGKKMTCLNAEETEGSGEKHLPVVTAIKLSCLEACDMPMTLVKVRIGEEPHPTLNNHYIKWIQLQTDKGMYRQRLEPGQASLANFIICGQENLINAFSYCNIHGLWVKKINSTHLPKK
ncbi:MAG: hypothetical protein MJ050_08790 [Phascolarctobacterium sp.]|nr:hypothetical protein [Phascolarctobacterium sp.]